MKDKMIVVSKVEEIWLWIPRYLENVHIARKEAEKFDDCCDIIESLEVIEDKLHSLDELLDIAIGESYKLNKEITNESNI